MADSQIPSRQKPEQSSGIISVDGDEVVWHNNDLVFATFYLSDIVVIGEHTNSNGPWFEDWFMTFVTKDSRWIAIPWYADNIEELTKILCDKFQPDLNVSHLASSTSWKSVIRYPERLKGKPLFVLTSSKNSKAPKSFFGRILSSVGFGNSDTRKEVDLTDDVKNELSNASRYR